VRRVVGTHVCGTLTIFQFSSSFSDLLHPWSDILRIDSHSQIGKVSLLDRELLLGGKLVVPPAMILLPTLSSQDLVAFLAL
jgi:hypothetical protein